MATLDDSPNPYFYLCLLVINDLGVLIHFIIFKGEVLALVNIAPS